MKTKLTLILGFLGFIAFKAQETVPYYQQYLLDGAYLFNPAHFGESDDVVLNANYQKQFTKFSESPNVQSVGVHANIFDRVGGGAYFFRDQNGPISANGIAFGVSYFIPLSDEDGRQDQFSFGTSVNLYNTNVDLSQLNPKDSGDPLLQSNSNGAFIAYSNIGMQATYKGFFGSAAVVDIPLSNQKAIVNGIEPSPTKFFIQGGYRWAFTEVLALEPSVLVNLNTNSSRLVDLNLMARFQQDEDYFAGGISYRTAKSVTGSEQLALSPIIKARFSRFTFGAAYNFNLSQVAAFGGNSFMLSIGYAFENFINPRGFRYR